MMYSKTIIIGRLGKDPDSRYTHTGQAVTSFSVATDRQYTGSDGAKVKETLWFRVTAWGKLAENCTAYLEKGKMVLVEGRLTEPRIWTDKNTNELRTGLELVAENMKFLSGKGEGGAGYDDLGAGSPTEDIPF